MNSYNIYRAPCTGTITAGVCSQIGTYTKIGSTPGTTYSDASTVLTALTSWTYYVTAVCPTLCSPIESGPSNVVAVTVPKDGAPNPPTGLSITQVAMNTVGNTSIVAASWQAEPNAQIIYTLRGLKNTGQPWKVLIQGVQSSTTGKGVMNWSGSKQSVVELEVCDPNGCATKQVSKTVTAGLSVTTG